MKLKQLVEKFGGVDGFVAETERQLRKLAEEQPDFVYGDWGNDCFYNKGAVEGTECSGCIFGQALQRMGWNDQKEMQSEDRIVTLMRRHAVVSVPHRWQTVQYAQDSGISWGDAVKELVPTNLGGEL